ncbi:hypothetical protein ACRALDRAFT_1080500 [Sodiomyces alcalophilus JCM 7366]|uniref:uncharacterized protein n=1 Tax=Sodiomyces alcalophilus JCM 7366 TaxID=591952 RepID=UPI0039B4C5EB
MVLTALLFLSAARLGLATRASVARDSVSATFHVIFEEHIPSGTTGLSVWSPDKSTLYGHSCHGPLALQGSELSVELSDDSGNGVLSFGGANYTLDFDPDVSGGISCYQKYNPLHVVVECLVPAVPDAALPSPVAREGAAECFSGLEEEGFASAVVGVEIEEDEAEPLYEPEMPEIEESGDGFDNDTATDTAAAPHIRPRCWPAPWTHPFNNGSPSRRSRKKQVGPNLRCTNGGCENGFGQAVSVSHSAGITLNGGTWISGGYSVSITKEHSSVMNCAGEGGDEVCVWHSQPHQRYQALRQERDCHGNFVRSSGRYWIDSPMSNHREAYFYCVRNHCRHQGASYWEDHGSGTW